MRKWILPSWRWLPWAALAVSAVAQARGGGGEHYQSDRRDPSPNGGGGEGFGWVLYWLVQATVRYPKVMCPLLAVAGVAYFVWQRGHNPTATTRKALDAREAEHRTSVSGRDVEGWVNALKLKDPAFELLPLLDRVKTLFLDLQVAWFKRDLAPVRPLISDAAYQRLAVQLQLLEAQNVRDAIADAQVLGLELIGLEQSEWYDTVHIRVQAQLRDTDVPARASDAEAIAAARACPLERFVEVWSFVRKPGAGTKPGEDASQGKCPNCGAPFRGGATNQCEFCNAVVNSGNYDWTLSEITQGIEHIRHYPMVDGLMDARAADPALNMEMLEDRASLIFWKWIAAQSSGQARGLSKLARPELIAELERALAEQAQRGVRRVFLECAVGAVIVRLFRREEGFDQAHVEVRWSAQTAVGPVGQAPPSTLRTIPQRAMLVLVRRAGATTNVSNGMATNRCAQCSAPLTDSASTHCDYCGAALSDGADWVLQAADGYEAWTAREQVHFDQAQRRREVWQGADQTLDPQERERLLYTMAALAAADGEVDPGERKLLKLCADRWSVPWTSVEAALQGGPAVFDRMIEKSSGEAEVFLRTLVELALVDGKVDRQERRMLQAAAVHLGLPDKLRELLARR